MLTDPATQPIESTKFKIEPSVYTIRCNEKLDVLGEQNFNTSAKMQIHAKLVTVIEGSATFLYFVTFLKKPPKAEMQIAVLVLVKAQLAVKAFSS